MQNMKDIEQQLQEWANRKPRPSSKIHIIKETIEKWEKEPETLIQAKSIIAEKIANKSVYDQLPVLLSLFSCALASSAPIFRGIEVWIYGLALILALLTPVIWMIMRHKSDYYNELQIIIDDLCKQNDSK